MKALFKFSLTVLLATLAPMAMNAQATVEAVTQTDEMTTVTVKVTGVGCMTDVRTISEQVSRMEGVASCEAAKRGAVTRFEVSYYPEQVCLDDIHQAVEATPGCKNPNDRPYRVKI